ncbi:MAG TPA: hypothetical protein VFV92_05590 [Candidatus Bathyarchaeia archaeon]|nr:hypothetical protein [Candidatus Bathyarchaeia archaeon]
MMDDQQTTWQRLSLAELDHTVRLMIGLHLIRRRRCWVLTGKYHKKVVPTWEYQVTWLGERVLAVLEWFTRRRILKP